tara:strand:+ start:262 stop:1014 length:753 start_codon:yes stop_codon:yes gene_type:complete
MSITYKRTMALKYTKTKLSDYDYYRLMALLDSEGLNVSSRFQTSPVGKYINKEVKEVSIVKLDGTLLYSTPYKYLCQTLRKEMEENNWDITHEMQTETIETEEWHQPKGDIVNFENADTDTLSKFTGKVMSLVDGLGIKYELPDDESLLLMIYVRNNTSLKLTFIATWDTARVKKGAVIKERMVNTILNDIGLIQFIFEESMGKLLLDSDIVLDEPEMDCYFEHISSSKSECEPDIIKQTREAKLLHRGD